MKQDIRINLNKRNISEQELLNDLTQVAEKLKQRTVSASQYEKLGKYGKTTILRRFKGWNDALLKAGLELTDVPREISDDELFENLVIIFQTLGHQPKYRDIKRPMSKYSMSTYENRFGSWNETLLKLAEKLKIEIDKSGIENIRDKKVIQDTREINYRLRYMILTRDKYTCRSCGASPVKDSTVSLEIDHIIPWSKGGRTELSNLQVLCSKCNSGKANI